MQSWWVIVVHRAGQSLHFHTTLFLGFKLWITERSQCRLVGGFQNRENLPVGVLFWSARKISGLWWWLVGMFLNWGFLPVLVLVAQQVLPLLCLSSTSSPSPHFLPPQMQQSSPKKSHTVTKRLNFALNNRSDGWESNCCTTGHWTPLKGALFHIPPAPLSTSKSLLCPPPSLLIAWKTVFCRFLVKIREISKLQCPAVSNCWCFSPPLLRHWSDCGWAAEQPVAAKVRMRGSAYLLPTDIDVTHCCWRETRQVQPMQVNPGSWPCEESSSGKHRRENNQPVFANRRMREPCRVPEPPSCCCTPPLGTGTSSS